MRGGLDTAADNAGDQARSKAFVWQWVGIITLFWIYAALSNVLYVRTLSAGLDPSGTVNYFAPWQARVLQYVFLYPVLLACLWASLRVGWRPLWRAVPVQLLLSLMFAVSATPLLAVAENLVGLPVWQVLQDLPQILTALFSGTRKSFWIANTTTFELTYGFALVLVSGFVLYRRFKDSELQRLALERAWSAARLDALRAQLSPHTLFNLLHTIRGHIVWDPPAAQAMVVQFGDLLRGLLAAGEQEFSTVRDEVHYARGYLELQRKRFEGRVKLSLPDAEALPSAWVPSLILQPLVENAVVHGVAGHEGEVSIRLDATVDDGMLVLRVVNSVVAQRAAERRGGGIGLRNVRERLAVHFADRCQFEAGLDESGQWRVEIRMPLLPVESAQRSVSVSQ